MAKVVLLILQVLKFAALIVAFVSGLIGTLQQTKDKDGALTNAGRWLVGLLVAAVIVAVGSQSLETYSDARERSAQDSIRRVDDTRLAAILTNASAAAQQAANASANAANASRADSAAARELSRVATRQISQMVGQDSLLKQATKQLTPLYPFDVQLRIAYPRSYPGFATYLQWLIAKRSAPGTLLLSIPVKAGSADAPDHKRNSMEFPAEILTQPWIEMSIYRRGNHNPNQPDLVLEGGANEVSPTLRAEASAVNYSADVGFELDLFNRDAPILQSATLVNPLIGHDSGLINSYLDLDQATLIIDLTSSQDAGGNLLSVAFEFKTGRRTGVPVSVSSADLQQWRTGDKQSSGRTVYRLPLRATRAGVTRAMRSRDDSTRSNSVTSRQFAR